MDGLFPKVAEDVDTAEPSPVQCPDDQSQNSDFSFPTTCNKSQVKSNRFLGASIDELLVIEVCAGSARLTKTCRKLGLRGLAIDKITSRSCGIDIMTLDLTVRDQLQLLLDIIDAEKDKLLLVFIAPPCGTASRARGRPIKSSLLKGRKAPQPLRTDSQPDGKDNLTGTDKLKTEMANQLYDALTEVILLAHSLDICVVVENPANSLYWKTSFALKFLQCIDGLNIDFHNCCHGGTRDKLTRFWVNKDWLEPLRLLCDKTHQHQSWRPRIHQGQLVFPTAEEAAYPWMLCTRIVNLILAAAQQLGAVAHFTLKSQMEQPHFAMMNRYILGALPRSTKLRPLVSEFAEFHYIITPAQHVDHKDSVLQLCQKGSKLLSRRLWKWGKFRAEQYAGTCKFLGLTEEELTDDQTVECHHVGTLRGPMDFVERAIEAGHPKDLRRHVDQALHEVILDNFHRAPHLLAQKRIDFVKKYTDVAKACKAEELKLRLKMPDHLRKLLLGKRLVLFGKMLADLDYPDCELVNDIATGFKLSGWMPDSNIFPKNVKSPTLTLDALQRSTDSFNSKVRRQMQLRQDSVLETDTWNETEHELEQGWIWEDDSGHWNNKVVARRFGIRQGQKTRVIDDCTVSGLNLTVGTKEKFTLHSIDQMCSMIDHSLELASGTHCPILGRTYDLKSAYKQFGLCVADRELVRIAVNKPGQEEPVLVGLNALPFGAIGSVAGFLRISFAIWWIGVFGLGIAWSAYFDDYSTITRAELESSTHWAVTTFFEMIGLSYAKEGPKAPPFNTIFKMLGLVVDLQQISSGKFFVTHTAERREELKQCLEEIAKNGELSAKEAERIRGRLLFFECFVCGRVANLDLKLFGNLCRSGRTTNSLTLEEIEIVSRLCERIQSGSAVPLGIKNLETWIIFTDGACEGDEPCGSVGGVLIAPNHRIVHHFGDKVPDGIMSVLLKFSSHPIHELEMIPVLISFFLWQHLFGGGQVVHYIDNESVRLALLRGSGETEVARKVAAKIMDAEFTSGSKSWYARVASESNIADAPSRLDFSLLNSLGSSQFEVGWNLVLASCTPPNGGT